MSAARAALAPRLATGRLPPLAYARRADVAERHLSADRLRRDHLGETGDVLAIRATAGNASPRKKIASFIDTCVAAMPKQVRYRYQLWILVDSAEFAEKVVEGPPNQTARSPALR
jgi:hypothetical protein